MNFPELIYKLTDFWFTSLWRFCGLLLLILTIRGDVNKGFYALKEFSKRVIHRYKKIVARDGLINKVKETTPTELKRANKIKLEAQ